MRRRGASVRRNERASLRQLDYLHQRHLNRSRTFSRTRPDYLRCHLLLDLRLGISDMLSQYTQAEESVMDEREQIGYNVLATQKILRSSGGFFKRSEKNTNDSHKRSPV